MSNVPDSNPSQPIPLATNWPAPPVYVPALPTPKPSAAEFDPIESLRELESLTKRITPSELERPKQLRVWGTDFAQVDMQQAIDLADRIVQRGVPEFLVTANLNYLMLTQQHPRLNEVNQRAAAVVADGFPMIMRSRLSSEPLPCRVAGADMVIELARLSEQRGYRLFFLGAAPGVAQAAAAALCRRFPALQIAGCYSPPFGVLTATEQKQMLSAIKSKKPDILLVAFGQPKGELWIYDHFQELDIPLAIQLGASFDFLAGTARRAPRFWQRVGCEWLFRACCDPKRLAPRYARNILFLVKLLIADLFAFLGGFAKGKQM